MDEKYGQNLNGKINWGTIFTVIITSGVMSMGAVYVNSAVQAEKIVNLSETLAEMKSDLHDIKISQDNMKTDVITLKADNDNLKSELNRRGWTVPGTSR